MKLKRALAQVTALATALMFTSAVCAESMKEIFDSLNANTNVSSPAILQGQTMNMYQGGSVFMRAPTRTYNLVSFTPPSYSAGCGGIDLYMGGFSHINKNAIGYAFKLAIQNLCPTCDNVMTSLSDMANKVNRLNIDSCEAAKGIVNASLPESFQKNSVNTAINAGTFSGYFADLSDAWDNVKNSAPNTKQALQEVRNRVPAEAESISEGNIVWKALNKQAHLGSSAAAMKYRMVLMSLIGTVILRPGDTTQPIQTIPPAEITVEALTGIGDPTKTSTIKYLECAPTDLVECLNPTLQPIGEFSLGGLVGEKIEALIDKISKRQAHASVPDLTAFLNTTEFPVYKMVAVSTSLGNTVLADSLMARWKALIAANYASAYLTRAAKDLRTAIAHYKNSAGPDVTAQLVEAEGRIAQVEASTRAVLANLYAQTLTNYRVAEELQHIERSMSNQMSQPLRQSMAFSKSLR
jgi:conjugative transfer pilus assembly protein TraH